MKKIILVASVLTLLMAGTAYAATLTGDDGPNIIFGTSAADTISGLGGQDKLYGKGGPDTIYGGGGKDYLNGGGGDDELHGGPDAIHNPKRGDEFDCGAGIDTIYVSGSEHGAHNWGPKCEQVVKEP